MLPAVEAVAILSRKAGLVIAPYLTWETMDFRLGRAGSVSWVDRGNNTASEAVDRYLLGGLEHSRLNPQTAHCLSEWQSRKRGKVIPVRVKPLNFGGKQKLQEIYFMRSETRNFFEFRNNEDVK